MGGELTAFHILSCRSFGGEVSWDKTAGLGATFASDDESVTHQIVDRPMTNKPCLSRCVCGGGGATHGGCNPIIKSSFTALSCTRSCSLASPVRHVLETTAAL